MGFVECVADCREVIVCEVSVSVALIKCRRPGYLPRRLPFHGVLPIILACFTTTELLYLPVKFSRSTLSMTAPKSTSDEGTEMDLTEIF